MKKLLLIILIILGTTACVKQEEFDNLKKENETLKEQLAQTTAENETLKKDLITYKAAFEEKEKIEKFNNEIAVKVVSKISKNGNYGTKIIELKAGVTNNSAKDIKGVQGVLQIKDMFGEDIKGAKLDFTGTTIKPGKTHFETVGFEANPFMTQDMKIFNEKFEDLIFEYTTLKVIFIDGTILENPQK